MKSWMVALASLVLGLLAGCGVTWYEFAGVKELFDAPGQAGNSPAPTAAPAPKVRVVGGLEYDFGAMSVMTTKSHEFVIENDGTAPLHLSKTNNPPSCKCTRFEIQSETISPGQSGKIILEWKPDTFNADFSQTAEVRTNDPTRELINVKIRGSVVEHARSIPGELTLSSISATEAQTAQARVFGYTADKLTIASFEFVDQDLAPFFEAHWEPLSKIQIDEEPLARSGVLLTVTTKPGLPLGRIDQTIRLVFDGTLSKTLDVPIKGSVASDISIVGPGTFDRENHLLKLGLVKAAQGSKTELRLLVKGPHRQDTRLEIATVDPAEVLKVNLGKPTEINNGKAFMYLLTIEIPPGAPSVNRIGSDTAKAGRILIETTHPQAKQLNIRVNFAVSE